MKSINKQKVDQYNFRKTDSNNDHCMNCKYCDWSSTDGFEYDCLLFKIKIDENHVCDLLN